MKITDVRAIYLRLPEIKSRTDSSQDALIIEVETDEGLIGYGEVDSCPSVAKAIIDATTSHTQVHGLRSLLLGEDPLQIRYLWNKMYQGTLYYGRSGSVIHAMAGVDLALWDLKGKALGQPVYRLLGGAFQRSIPAYASHMFGFTPQETAARAKRAVDGGFRAVKFGWEPFGRAATEDEAQVRAIRNAVGQSTRVMIDVGLAWDAPTTIQRAKMLQPYDVFWLEEPVPPDDLVGYSRIAGHIEQRLAAGEQECTPQGFVQLMDRAKVDVVQIDMTRVGITQAMVIAEMALQRGIKVCNHAFTTRLNTAAAAHFLAAIPNALMLEYCVEPGELTQKLVRSDSVLEDGSVRVGDDPGLGVLLDREVIDKYRV